MKTKTVFPALVLFICVSFNSIAQTTQAWTLVDGGKHNEVIHAFDFDDSGNIYVTGTFQDTSSLFGEIVISTGREDIFIASIKPDGSLEWLKHGGGVWEDGGLDICVNHDFIYVVGNYTDQISIGDTLLNSAGTMDVFIVKYDLNGVFQWAESAGGVNVDIGKSITVDDSGNVVITGVTNYTAKFGDYTVPYFGFSDMFVAKYNSEGVCQWAASGGGTVWDGGECVEITKSGDVVVGGYFNDQAVFDTITVSSAEYADMFIARYSPDGIAQEVVSAGGPGNEAIQCMAIDSSSNIYISGWYMDNITIGSEKYYSSGIYDIFIAKYKPGAGFVWSRSLGGYGSDEASGMDVSPNNELFLTGTFEETVDFGISNFISAGFSDGFLARMDTSGSLNWIFQIGGTGSLNIADCKADLNGNYFLAGGFVDELNINGKSYNPAGGYDLFLARLDGSASGLDEILSTLNSGVYPNPFGSTVNFFYIIHQKSDVQLNVYNSNGQLIISRLDKEKVAGKHILEMDGSILSRGIYFYTMETKEGRSTGKIIKL